jgi:5-methylcytosine-specific restriction endonuclease McrA
MDVLILNNSYEPLQVLSMRKAVKLLAKNRADLIKSKEGRTISSRYQSIPMPSVIRLNQYVKYARKPVPYSKKNVLIRDQHTCQYCGIKNASTIDHIIPQSKGGQNTWENTVACCVKCNTKKADVSLAKSGFTLNRQPRRPSQFVLLKYLSKYPEWNEFLYC